MSQTAPCLQSKIHQGSKITILDTGIILRYGMQILQIAIGNNRCRYGEKLFVVKT